MDFIPAAGVVKTAMQFSLAGQEAIWTFHFKRTTPWTQLEREALNDALAGWWTSAMKIYMNANIGLVSITTTNLDTQEAPSSVKIISPAEVGTLSSGAAASNNIAMCATLRTALRGRSYRGRLFLGGFGVAQLQDALTFTSSALAVIGAALASLKAAVEALGAVWVVLSKWHNGSARTTAVATPITAIAIDQYIDSQRRRLGMRGV